MKKLLQSELFNNLKKKASNYGFWVSLASSIVVFLQAIGIKVQSEVVSEVVGAICSIFIVLGIISNPTSGHGYIDKPELKQDKILDNTKEEPLLVNKEVIKDNALEDIKTNISEDIKANILEENKPANSENNN